jgi:hypothetical protein
VAVSINFEAAAYRPRKSNGRLISDKELALRLVFLLVKVWKVNFEVFIRSGDLTC